MDEQAVLPRGRVVRGELLVEADQLLEARVILGERLEPDSLRRALDLDPASLTNAEPATSRSSIVSARATAEAPFAVNDSGSKPSSR